MVDARKGKGGKDIFSKFRYENVVKSCKIYVNIKVKDVKTIML